MPEDSGYVESETNLIGANFSKACLSVADLIAEFDIGDKVRHRASGRIAIVTAQLFACVTHRSSEMCFMMLDRSTCRFEPTGRYNLSFDFGDDAEYVSGVLLEPVLVT